ncbi:MAG: glycosyltransferase family 2 protein [Ignavibacteriales bacterium]|nr:glycosyltransferase family 2 protein [Ignavibacteriales bacterium]
MGAKDPVVSVILPTRNRSQLLSRAMKSVLAQTFPDFELIVIDEGSTDDTPRVVESFVDERIHSIRHEVFRGPGAARNAGVELSRGEYITFLDDDDEFLPNKLKDQTDAFRKSVSAVGIVISDVQVFRDGTPVEYFPYDGDSGNIFLHFLAGHFFPLNASMIRRSAIPAFDDKLSCLEDIDFHLRVVQKSKALYHDALCALYNIDEHRKRLSHDRVAMHRSFRTLETRWFNDPEDTLLKEAQAELLVNFPLRLMRIGYMDEITREYLNKAFKMKKDGRRTWYRLLNLLGPSMLKRFH